MDATEVNDNYRDEKIPAVQDAKRRRKAIGHIYRHSLHFMEHRQHRRKKAAGHRQATLTDIDDGNRVRNKLSGQEYGQ